MTARNDRALVLGGGGVAGIAWMAGVFAGLADGGADVADADRVIGTSAGAAVAAQICCGLTAAELHARQVDPALQADELAPPPGLQEAFSERLAALVEAGDPDALVRDMGRLALATVTVGESVRRAAVASRLLGDAWPDRPLILVAADAASGETRLFDRASGATLVDAVAASCAVPGVWPPVTIAGRRYIDGGVRSLENADLATGAGRVLVVSPRGTRVPHASGRRLIDHVAALRTAGAAVMVIEPDKAGRAAMGANRLAPETRIPAAEAGRALGRALAPEVAAFWR